MYNIRIKIDGFEKRKRNSALLHILVGFFFIIKGADYYHYLEYRTIVPSLPFLVLGSISIFYGLFRRRLDPTGHSNNTLRTFQFLSFLVLGVIMISKAQVIDYGGIFVFAFLCFLLLVSERRIFQETLLKMDDEGIMIPGYFKDHRVTWAELSDIRIREDFITLFHVRQKYLQYQVMQDLSSLELAKLSAFAKDHIQKSQTVINLN